MRRPPICSASLVLVALAAGCEAQPGEDYAGVVRAPAPVLVPSTRKPVCIGLLELEVRHRSGTRTHTSYQRSPPTFAPSASLELPDGTRLAIVGTTDRLRLTQSTDVWSWVKEDGGRPPEELYGRGLDDELDLTQDPEIDNGPIAVEARERFVECGANVALRGVRKGEALHLIETNDVESSNVLAFFGLVAGAFFLFLVVPIVVVIIVVVRRSRAKAAR